MLKRGSRAAGSKSGRRRESEAEPAAAESTESPGRSEATERPARPVGSALSPTGGSRVEKRKQRRRRRTRTTTAGIVALALVAAVVATLVVRKAVEPDKADPVHTRTQVTMLMLVRRADGKAAASVLLAHDPGTDKASMAFIPPTVRVLAPAVGSGPYENVLALGGAKAARDAVAELLGVTVDHDWTLTPAALAALVDRVGTIEVDVDVDVLQPAGGGRSVVLLNTGSQKVDGARAAVYATYVAPGEAVLAAMPRLQRVVEGILEALPETPTTTTVLSTLQGSKSSLDAPRLTGFLESLAAALEAEQVSFATLPVVAIETGGGVQQYTLDEVQAQELVRSTLADSVPEGRFAGDNRVILLNGIGRPGVTRSAQERLRPQGFDIVKIGNANRFNYATSVVLVKDATAEAQELGEKVATALQLPATAVQIYSQENTVSDVIVILGGDYKG
jgi:anionic cell wall polymer biosynthesis LytR-Cps2A-Psr (LCP) family protein